MRLLAYLSIALILAACGSEIKEENKKLVKAIDHKVKNIDHHHRIQIVEDDFIQGDSTFKIRGYLSEGRMQKLVGITRTAHFERDDYFYFENERPIFSGHMINFMDEKLAEEFKYYYRGKEIVECLFWEDHYDPNKRFPHEEFKSFSPNMDSLMAEENSRLAFFMGKLKEEGFELKEENDNLNN